MTTDSACEIMESIRGFLFVLGWEVVVEERDASLCGVLVSVPEP